MENGSNFEEAAPVEFYTAIEASQSASFRENLRVGEKQQIFV